MGECLIIRGGGGTDTSNANATASVVLTGYTCYVDDQLIAGSMPVQTLNQKLGAGGSVTIPAGYYDGSSSVISTSTLAEETAANAASSHILSGYNGWVNGGLVQGSMTNWGNTGATLAANGVYWIPAGWHAGAGVVNQSLAIHWGGTYTPNTGNQVMCWAGWYTGGNIVVLGSSNLIASNIRNGVNIFGVTGNFSGWADDRSSWVIWPTAPMHYPNVLSPTYYTYTEQSQSGIVSNANIWNVQPYISGWNTFWVRFTADLAGTFSIWVYNSAGTGKRMSFATNRHTELNLGLWFNNPSASNSLGMSSSEIVRIRFYSASGFGFDTMWMQYGLT